MGKVMMTVIGEGKVKFTTKPCFEDEHQLCPGTFWQVLNVLEGKDPQAPCECWCHVNEQVPNQ